MTDVEWSGVLADASDAVSDALAGSPVDPGDAEAYDDWADWQEVPSDDWATSAADLYDGLVRGYDDGWSDLVTATAPVDDVPAPASAGTTGS